MTDDEWWDIFGAVWDAIGAIAGQDLQRGRDFFDRVLHVFCMGCCRDGHGCERPPHAGRGPCVFRCGLQIERD